MQNADGSVIIKLSLDYGQFEKDTERSKRSISQAGKEMERGLQQAQRQYDQSSKKAEEFRRILNRLDTEIDQLQASLIDDRGFRDFVDAGLMTEEQLSDVVHELTATNSEFQKLTASATRAQEKFDFYTAQMREAESVIQSFSNETDDAAQSIKEMGESAKSAEKPTKQVGDEIKNAGDNAERAANGGITTLKVAFGSLVADGIRLAIRALKDFLGAGIEYGAGLTEVQNVVDTVFGAQGALQIEAWSKTTLKSIGLSELTVKKYSSTLGSMIDAMGVSAQKNVEMSMTLTRLTGDWASFRDKKPQEVFEKIRSAISGETEAIKELGIVMTANNLKRFAQQEHIKKSYEAMTEAEKVTLRYNYILEKSSKVLGDFAKTSDSFHNQQTLLSEQTKELAGRFADEFLPALTEILSETNDYLAKNGDTLAGLGKIVATVANALGFLLKMFAAIPPELVLVVGTVLLLVKVFSSTQKGLTKLGQSFGGASGFLDPFTVKILALVAAISVLLFLILSLKEGTDKAARSMESLGDTSGRMANQNVASARGGAARSFAYQGRATGTPHAPPGWAWVGEEGPELLRFAGGEQVLTAAQSANYIRSAASMPFAGIPGYSAPGISNSTTYGAYHDQRSYNLSIPDERMWRKVTALVAREEQSRRITRMGGR